MVNSKEIVIELTDLPNYKNNFTGPLAQIGVSTIDDLRQVLMDEDRTISMISAVKGLGPKTVQDWKSALTASEEPTDGGTGEAEVVLVAAVLEPEETDVVLSEVVLEAEEVRGPSAGEGLPPKITGGVPAEPKGERNLSCTMEDLSGIQQTAIDLLRMNGAKKKGLLASVDYVTKRLNAAGLNVTVDKESGAPTILASKGEGGLVLWGHLDTDILDDMEKKEQGVVQGDIIHGRGAANMKGAVAAMICAAERAAAWPVPFSIVLTTDALGDQQGAKELAKSPALQNSKGVLIFGPTGMRPVIGQAGYAAIRVRISGEGAVMQMASFLDLLSGQVQESSGRLAVKVGMIRGGKRKRPFGQARSCEVAMELETMDATDSAIRMINELLTEKDYQIEELCRSEMVEFDRSSDLTRTMTKLTMKEPVFMMVHSEATEIVPMNRKIVICGPGTMANIASDQEFVTLRELEGTYEAILGLIDGSASMKS